MKDKVVNEKLQEEIVGKRKIDEGDRKDRREQTRKRG